MGAGSGPAAGGIPFGAAPDRYEAKRQAELAAEFPDRDVLYVLGGYVAVPKGTTVVVAASLSTLREKLRGS